MTVKTTGVRQAQDALTEATRDINIASEEMLAAILQGISAHTMPYVPVDTSALINSEWRTTTDTSDGPVGEIGYGRDGVNAESGTPVSEYAWYVHEGGAKNWQKPGASDMFLLLGTDEFIDETLPIIVEAYE